LVVAFHSIEKVPPYRSESPDVGLTMMLSSVSVAFPGEGDAEGLGEGEIMAVERDEDVVEILVQTIPILK
jgi:hypothetical protein